MKNWKALSGDRRLFYSLVFLLPLAGWLLWLLLILHNHVKPSYLFSPDMLGLALYFCLPSALSLLAGAVNLLLALTGRLPGRKIDLWHALLALSLLPSVLLLGFMLLTWLLGLFFYVFGWPLR